MLSSERAGIPDEKTTIRNCEVRAKTATRAKIEDTGEAFHIVWFIPRDSNLVGRVPSLLLVERQL